MPTSLQTERLSLGSLTLDDHDFNQVLVDTEGWLWFIGDRHVRPVAEAMPYITKTKNSPNVTY